MAQKLINHGTTEGDGTGESPFTGMSKVNDNFTELYTAKDAQAAALALKAPLNSPAFTGTPTGITKAHVGLGNVDNTPDGTKPVSTPQQAAIDAGDAQRIMAGDLYDDFVASGLVTPTSASLTAVTTDGVAYVNGVRVVKAVSDTDLTFTYLATRDTYVDMDDNGVISRSAVVNGAAAPALASGSLRLEKVVTGASAVTSVTSFALRVVKAPPVQIITTPSGGVVITGSDGKAIYNRTRADNYKATLGMLLDNYSTSYAVGTWVKPVSGTGTATEPSAGIPYITLTSGATAGNYGQCNHKSISPAISGMATTDGLFLDVEFPDGTNASDTIQVGFSSDNFTSLSITATLTLTRRHEGRCQLYFKGTDFASGNGEVITASMNYMHVRYTCGTTGTSKTCKVYGLYQNSKSRPNVIITFDDGWDGAYASGFNYMQQKGLRGTMFVIKDTLGTAGYMTEAQMQELYDAGWDLGVHSVNQHDTLGSQAAVSADIAYNKSYLTSKGWVGAEHILAYPGGVTMPYSYAALADNGITVARTTSDKLFAPEFGSWDKRMIAGWAANGSSSAAILANVDKAISHGKTVVLYMHDIELTPGPDDIDPTTFTEVIDGLLTRRAAGSCDLPTFTEYLRGLNY